MPKIFRFAALGVSAWGLGYVGYEELVDKQHKVIVEAGRKSIINSIRATNVLVQALTHYYSGLKGLEANSKQYKAKLQQIHSIVANKILSLSQDNLGIYLKFGQYLGSLNKVVPQEYTDVLKKLQDQAPSVPYQQIKILFQEDLGQSPNDIFDNFEKQAFSAASIAQVHRAKIGNENLAVKLQFPTLRHQTQWDLYVMKRISQLLDYIIKKTEYKQLDIPKLFSTWTKSLKHQLDFEEEIRNGLKAKEMFHNDKYVHVPEYYPQYCSSRIIVMEYVEGCKIIQKQKIEKLGINPLKVANKLIDIMGKMIFKYGFVHCDAHPGNILVRASQHKKGEFQIILLDHGMYQELDPKFLKSFADLWLGMISQNRNKVAKAARQLNIHDHIEYLPLLFMNRTSKSSKKIGENLTVEQKVYLKDKNLRNFDDISKFIQDLPPELMFIIRASNLVANHNLALGGTRRNRILAYTKQCAMQSPQYLRNYTAYPYINYSLFRLKLWLYQKLLSFIWNML